MILEFKKKFFVLFYQISSPGNTRCMLVWFNTLPSKLIISSSMSPTQTFPPSSCPRTCPCGPSTQPSGSWLACPLTSSRRWGIKHYCDHCHKHSNIYHNLHHHSAPQVLPSGAYLMGRTSGAFLPTGSTNWQSFHTPQVLHSRFAKKMEMFQCDKLEG